MPESDRKQNAPVTAIERPRGFRVLTIDITAQHMDQAVGRVLKWVAQGTKTYVNVCSTHTAMEAYDDPRLAEIINHAGMTASDGMPLVFLGRMHGLDMSRVYGPDLMLAVCDASVSHGVRHYLYGSTPDVLAKLRAALEQKFPGIKFCGSFSPPFRKLSPEEDDTAVDHINAARPDIVWVGLGTPKQDLWVGDFRPRLDAPVLIAVGAAFPFHAGEVRQAPRWMMRSGLEWLFRLLTEPRRLWKRYVLGNPRFVYLLMRQWIREGVPRRNRPPGTPSATNAGSPNLP